MRREGRTGTGGHDAATHSTNGSDRGREPERIFEEVMAPERDRILAYLYGMCGERETALDLAQETYLVAWRGIAGFRGESAPLTWLVGIARRVCLRWLRREGRRARALAAADLGRGPWPAAGPAPAADAPLLDAERAARVRLALLALAPERREAIVLHYFVGLPLAEIARVARTSVGTVKSRLARAREALGRSLSSDLEPE